ncbi:hypothetical protein WJX73_003250 [Symbiochloris irregularis]|uniref:Uncharacterized protein n=1 Tax=Symbiochloris irregularis TaxID=706552 RepID=A0AAW1PWC0_9CHLO
MSVLHSVGQRIYSQPSSLHPPSLVRHRTPAQSRQGARLRRSAVVHVCAQQKTLIVSGTGNSEGIGRAAVRVFLEAGWKAVGLDVKDPEGEEDDEVLQAHKDSYKLLKADMTDSDQISDAVAQALDFFGEKRVNCLVNNAGIASPAMPKEKKERKGAFEAYIQTNLTGAFLLSEECTPYFAKGDSSIIHVSSIHAEFADPDTHGYTCAKAGMRGLSRCQAVTLDKRTRVNVIFPGYIDTPGASEEVTKEMRDWHLTGRVGSNKDIAEACLFLGDEQRSGFITGAELMIDGGVSAKLFYPQ